MYILKAALNCAFYFIRRVTVPALTAQGMSTSLYRCHLLLLLMLWHFFEKYAFFIARRIPPAPSPEKELFRSSLESEISCYRHWQSAGHQTWNHFSASLTSVSELQVGHGLSEGYADLGSSRNAHSRSEIRNSDLRGTVLMSYWRTPGVS